MLSKVIKQNAKKALKANFWRAVVVLLILGLVACIFNVLSTRVQDELDFWTPESVSDIYTGSLFDKTLVLNQSNIVRLFPSTAFTVFIKLLELLIYIPLGLGVTNWYLSATDGKYTPIRKIFWPFETNAYGKSILLHVRLFITKIVVILIVTGIPAFVMMIIMLYLYGTNQAAMVAVGAGMILAILITLILAEVFMTRYDLAQILLCKKYCKSVSEAIKLSVRYTKKSRWQIFGFKISFLPWFLLGVFVFPLVWVTPYYCMSVTMLERFLYEDGLNKDGLLDASNPKDIVSDDDTPDTLVFGEEKKESEDSRSASYSGESRHEHHTGESHRHSGEQTRTSGSHHYHGTYYDSSMPKTVSTGQTYPDIKEAEDLIKAIDEHMSHQSNS